MAQVSFVKIISSQMKATGKFQARGGLKAERNRRHVRPKEHWQEQEQERRRNHCEKSEGNLKNKDNYLIPQKGSAPPADPRCPAILLNHDPTMRIRYAQTELGRSSGPTWFKKSLKL